MSTLGPGTDDKRSRTALASGLVASVLASSCCLGPLVLIWLGVSGAWISNLTALEPYRPLFLGAALIALIVAGRGIWARSPACTPGHACARPPVRRGDKLVFAVVVILVLIALGFPLIAPWFY